MSLPTFENFIRLLLLTKPDYYWNIPESCRALTRKCQRYYTVADRLMRNVSTNEKFIASINQSSLEFLENWIPNWKYPLGFLEMPVNLT